MQAQRTAFRGSFQLSAKDWRIFSWRVERIRPGQSSPKCARDLEKYRKF